MKNVSIIDHGHKKFWLHINAGIVNFRDIVFSC